ncbi:MAG: glycogen synthase [Candidatus Aenigmarchaeota archaeon]|nr:glycogen synthase [Candidatus Aenigmarchaeota archaeon]MDW8149813.1 glycogen synthase [Candidatus Aenigmarchaeota archaeon]
MTKEYPPYIYGGAGVHIKNLSEHISKYIDVEVRCFGDQNFETKNLKIKGYGEWKEIAELEKHSSVLRVLSTGLMISNENPNCSVVHTHTWYASFPGFLIKMLYNVPLVVTCHSLEPLRPWKADQIGRGYNLSLWVEKNVIENADRVIAVSQEMKNDILKHFNIEEKKVVVIHNGVDIEKWKKVTTKKALEKYGVNGKYVLFVGRTTKQKGIETLLEAAKFINATVVIVTAGADTKEYFEEIKNKSESIKNVKFIGKMLTEEETIEFYSNASVFVCPSIYEPFGIINLEAMACKTPVVASYVGGIKEIIVDGETGFYVEPQKPMELAKMVNIILENPELARKMGENGRNRVVEKFSWDNIAKKTIELYKEIAH